jgi:hypothetical protein
MTRVICQQPAMKTGLHLAAPTPVCPMADMHTPSDETQRRAVHIFPVKTASYATHTAVTHAQKVKNEENRVGTEKT